MVTFENNMKVIYA